MQFDKVPSEVTLGRMIETAILMGNIPGSTANRESTSTILVQVVENPSPWTICGGRVYRKRHVFLPTSEIDSQLDTIRFAIELWI